MAENYRTALQTGEPSQTFSVDTNATQILLPDGAQRITVGSQATNLYLGFGARTDGAAMATADAIYVKADNYFEMLIPNGVTDCFVAAVAGSGTATIIMEQR
jgi:hypothetical protein